LLRKIRKKCPNPHMGIGANLSINMTFLKF
jgi:hypothetical protein